MGISDSGGHRGWLVEVCLGKEPWKIRGGSLRSVLTVSMTERFFLRIFCFVLD